MKNYIKKKKINTEIEKNLRIKIQMKAKNLLRKMTLPIKEKALI